MKDEEEPGSPARRYGNFSRELFQEDVLGHCRQSPSEYLTRTDVRRACFCDQKTPRTNGGGGRHKRGDDASSA